MTSWAQRLVSIAGLGIPLLLSMCSSLSADGGECEANDDCKSERCRNNRCDGHYCICDGADCRGKSDCDDGWLCVQPSTLSGGGLPTPFCQRVCSGRGTCPPGDHCETGVCRPGGEPFSIEWVSFPRARPCSARVPCTYKVKVPAEVNVVKYKWTFSEGESPETAVPETTHTYPKQGTYAVTVTATSGDGANATLSATETLCIAQGGDCEPGAAPCCNGQCSIQNKCPE